MVAVDEDVKVLLVEEDVIVEGSIEVAEVMIFGVEEEEEMILDVELDPVDDDEVPEVEEIVVVVTVKTEPRLLLLVVTPRIDWDIT